MRRDVKLLYDVMADTRALKPGRIKFSDTYYVWAACDLILGVPEIWTVRVRQSVKLHTYSQKHNQQVTEHPVGSN